jgi:hypothetical protein
VYAWYNVGTVGGLVAAPLLARAAGGWAPAFLAIGAAGVAGAAAAARALPPAARGPAPAAAAAAKPAAAAASASGGLGAAFGQVAFLAWTHSVISFGFFVLQAWIPTFLCSLGVADLGTLGLLSALPWLASAGVSVGAGRLADALQACGWPALRVRRLMQSVGSAGGLFLAPLAFPGSPAAASPALAVALLTAAVAAQGFNYAGFHAYVQDVAPADAGKVLGVTNTCGTLAGLGGNLVTGALAGGAGGYAAVFGLAAALYGASALTWLAFARGAPVRLGA